MTLTDCFRRLEEPTRTITVYAPPPRPALVGRLEPLLGVGAVTYRPLPADSADEQAFLVVHEDDAFVAAIGLEAVREFIEPPIHEPWADALDDATYRRMIEVFESTVWQGLDRRQLLAVSREIENRAWQLDSGTLRVGFQRSAALEAMAPVYARLGGETNLEIHVYIDDAWDRPSIPGVTVHAEAGGEIGSFWFLIFDGDGDELWTSALLARPVDGTDGAFEGYWTDEPQLVSAIDRAVLERTD